jgi:Acyl-CoA hydrolase
LGIVTAACDRIDLTGSLPSNSDLQLLASVNWVGRSAIEVGIRISTKSENDWKHVARAFFIMVSRRRDRAEEVNPLAPKTREEQRRFKEGQDRQRLRREMSRYNILTVAPDEQESKLLHLLFLEIREGRLKRVTMAETLLRSTLLMHPQFRNIHNKIFGGYLMREAFELAWNITYLFCGHRPQFLSVDHMYFYEPVEIASILSFTGQVIYNSARALMVEVASEVIDPASGITEVTNVSYFTFSVLDKAGNSLKINQVQPESYEEGLKYLDGSSALVWERKTKKSFEVNTP